MDIINKLQPKSYTFRHDGNYKLMNLPAGQHYGLIAQDVEKVLPELVKATTFETRMAGRSLKNDSSAKTIKPTASGTSENIDFKALNYTELLPIVIKGMQEQQAEIQELNRKNTDLQNEVNELRSLLLKAGTSITSGGRGSYLKQNIPNPAKNNTVIGYYVEDNAGRALIKITDTKGADIKVYNASKGQGQLTIAQGELAAGIYNYTMYIDHKKVDTKRMIIIE
ncbi:tail fiber domain-containing protein [Segetibacter koreensis]|uniref:tail fiber domain-containing protein n=1 Tax=Segetibacter koreensis TaxID=398037 RepID=UPI00035D0B07|nr:tail fiber domain-containing protein [Segetibacter koreensis]